MNKTGTCSILFLLVLTWWGTGHGLELPMTAGQAVNKARYVAHVMVLEHYPAAGMMRGIHDYTLKVVDNCKGSLPEAVIVRVLEKPGKGPVMRDSHWIVMLMDKNSHGIYPLVSQHWGMVPVREGSSEELVIARPLDGLGSRRRYTLDEFRVVMKGHR